MRGHPNGRRHERRGLQGLPIGADRRETRMFKRGDDGEGKTFLPAMKELVEADLSHDGVKRLIKIPATWGAKITGEQFEERASRVMGDPGGGASSCRG